MLNITFPMLAAGALAGQLTLQEPSSEFYYSRDTVTVLAAPLVTNGTWIDKGSVLLTIQPEHGDERHSLVSKSDGYVDYVSDKLSPGYRVTAGEMLFIIRSARILAKHELTGQISVQEINQQQTVWLCDQAKVWPMRVDEVTQSSLLVSTHVRAGDYADLKSISQKPQLSLYKERHACLADSIKLASDIHSVD
ncbi:MULTISPECIES: hypothetical protein [unclassified Pseudoalteromonas]|uniref:hypothetical protein n=1 Tax=unclassified Pseudoalteromonas TaxID=194690 RepID=UPI002097AC38|nr:hypothetical protein [Pseudoalteromonas sp. XMcav2-N]MCO7191362.1 hypothetical protein [Pseudoalteromonas sp. XMcav2-N]